MTSEGSRIERFFGGVRLRVRPAPEPAEIIWENLDISAASRALRTLASTAITLAILGASFVLIFQGQQAQRAAEFKYPGRTDCSTVSVYPGADPAEAQRLYNFSLADPGVLLQSDVEKDVNWEFFNKTVGNTGKLECFCAAIGFSPAYKSSHGTVSMYNYKFVNAETDEEEKWCGDWFRTRAYVGGLKYAAVGGIAATNVLLHVSGRGGRRKGERGGRTGGRGRERKKERTEERKSCAVVFVCCLLLRSRSPNVFL